MKRLLTTKVAYSVIMLLALSAFAGTAQANKNLIISANPSDHSGGSVTTPGEGTFSVANTATPSIVATPAAHWHFVNWTGSGAGQVANVNLASTTISMANSNQTIVANFAIDQLTVTASAGANGSISPSGAVVKNYGTSQLFTATPNSGYAVNTWSVDSSVVQTGGNTYTLSNITAAHTVSVTFKQVYTLTASSGANGTVTTPGVGAFVYDAGTVANLAATPNANYHFVNWTGTGVTAGKVANANSASTTITMDGNYTVTANFAIDQKTLTASSGGYGSVTTPGEGAFVYNYGTVVNLAATPATNYHFVNWTGTGVTAGKVANPNSASTTITLDSNYTVVANFAIDQKSLTTSATTGGTVTTPGIGTYNYDYGTVTSITASPNTGYHFVNWTGTGVTAGKVASPTSASTSITMDGNYTAIANFAIDQFTVTASADTNGSISPSGALTKDYGSSQLFTATPTTGYVVDTWSVDGSTVQTGGTTYTLSNITATHTVAVSFKILTYQITASAGTNGSISPSGTITKDYGSSELFTATPNTGYEVDKWTVDSTVVQTGGTTYTLSNITATHTVSVSFKILTYTISGNTGVGGVSLGGLGVTSNGSGDYTTIVDYGWSVTVIPSKTGYTFNPVNKTYTAVAENHTGDDYIATLNTYTIAVSAGANGTIDPSGDITKDHSSSQLFMATPATGYQVDTWSVDGSTVQTGGTTYTLSNITATHTVAVSFKILTYTITVSAGSNGSISPSGTVTKNYDESQLFTATPTTGYEVDKWSVDGSQVQTGGTTYTLSNITATHTVAVSFKILTYQVTASAGLNGLISPTGAVTKDYGSNQLFTATPTTGYEVDKWLVDGSEVQSGGATYTLSNITATHTVSVTFKIFTYTVNASAGTNGSISPSGTITKDYGSSELFTAAPNTGYEVDKWTVDSTVVQTGGTTYTLSNITATHTVSVTFKIFTYTVNASAGTNGSISPSGTITKDYGSSQLFTAAPSTGYEVETWSVDGSAVQTGGTTYTLSNITATHTVSVTFKILTYTITGAAGTNGSISPSGATTKNYGSNQLFTATPTTGYAVDTWSVDGSTVQTGGTTYTLSNITAGHAVAVSFKPFYTITASAGANGSINPVGSITKYNGENQLFTATPSTGYEVDTWSVDSTVVQTGGTTYTLSNITDNHTVAVTFKILTYTVTGTAGTNGSISPSGASTKDYGSSQLFTAAPAIGYDVDTWSVDGSTAQTGGTTYTLSNITAIHTVSVTFKILTYTITPSAGASGSISPSVATVVNYGSNQLFTATPTTGYEVDKWSVDGSQVQTGGTTYTLSNITAAHTVSVTFKILTYTVTASAGTNGSISPTGAVTKDYGTNQLFTATPATGYQVDTWSVDGTGVQTGGTTYTLSNITAAHTVSVTFKLLTYAITTSAGTNGTISPTNPTVNYGENQTFTATPSTGYEVDKWSVDSSPVQTSGTTYTLNNVIATHTVSVTFKILTYTITPSAGANGSISPSVATVANYGSNQLFTATPTTGYEVDKWSVDGSQVQTGGITYTLSNITAAHTVSVTFKILTYTVTASAGTNGSISPTGAVTKDYGTNQLFTATPAIGYQVDTWSVDGTGVQAGGTTYTLSNITATHTVNVTFKLLTYAITTSAGSNGTISPTNPIVNYGANQTFTATPSAGYQVDTWSLDGTGIQTGGNSYTLNNVTATHTVSVTFKPLTYTVTTSAGANGSISPTNPTVNYGTNQTFTATPSTGYQVDTWKVDGSTVQTGGTTYTLSNITATHTVAVTFKILTYTVTASAGNHGSITPSGATVVDYSANQLFTATPNSGWTVDTWSVDSTVVQTGGITYSLNNIIATHTVSVTFKHLTITASAGANGTVTPTSVTVNYGSNQTFTATPNTGYQVDTWSVDSSPVQTGGTTYTLSNITDTHTVSVTFKILTYTVTPSAGTNGSISPSGTITKDYGSSQLFTATPSTNYQVDTWKVDGSTVQTGGTTYTLSNITAMHTVTVTFKLLTYTITTSAGSNGSISPINPTVDYGSNQTFTATPSTGYQVDTWKVDGSTVQTGGTTYTLSNITATHTVSVTFKFLTYTVTTSTGANGSISPTNPTVNYGSNQTFTATPSAGYQVDIWKVDGSTIQTGGTTYTLSNITATHTVAVTFIPIEYTLTINTVGNGSVAKSPNQATYHYGDAVTLTPTADAGWTFSAFSGDTTTNSITMDGNKSVTATFTQNEYTLTINKVGNGSVAASPEKATYHYGDIVTLTATADAGWTFSAFTGDTTTNSITIDGNKSVTATFTQNEYTLTINKVGNGSVAASPEKATYHYGDVVTLTATADAGWIFGAFTGDMTTNSITIDGNKTVTATFTQNEYTLTIDKVGNGSVTASPEQATYHYGDTVTLTATADAGWTFGAWSGDTTTNSITIDGNKSVTVTFTILTYTITASAGIHGSVGPVSIDKDYGSDQMFTTLPDTNYEVDKWSVDGAEVQTGGLTYTLSDITATHTVSVTFKLGVLIISGYIIEPDGNTPVVGAVVDANNNGGSIGVTDANGYYEVMVPPGWSGTATPIKAGYSFEPYKMDYSNVAANTEKDYAATPLTYIISGYIVAADGITPFAAVNVIADSNGGPFTSKYGKVSNDGGPCLGRFGSGSAVTDANGYYEVMVDYNWSGKVTAAKYSYAFAPDKAYTGVIADQSGQNFTGEPMTFAISGHVLNNCNVPIQGVTVSADNGGNTVVTDANGFYEVWGSFNWSGTVTVGKALYTFAQSNTGYTDILSNQTDQDYHGNNIYDLDCDNAIGYSDIAVISENWLSDTTGNICDLNADGTVNFTDYAKFANIWITEGQ